MDLKIYGKNVEITPEIRDYVQKKMDKLSRFLPNMGETKVEIVEEQTKSPKDKFTVQITVRGKGSLLRGEERAAGINLGVDAVTDVLARQITKYKGKFVKKGHGTPAQLEPAEPAAKKAKNRLPELVRVKRFLVKSMSTEEAAEQMELTSHDFFLFIKDDTRELNLLYRRKDGNYGLIEPELDID
jgi:putative sigma-54 modulation protein